ncbi:response regulator [Geobacter sp.]|uniref:response regulator n=1 Tax=Geobacter sp. TaxID=46610 RepID=UPI00260956EA|nr:response regulator [Geobacter sp.]
MNLTRNEGGGPGDDSGSGRRIIVVDDDHDVLFFVKAVLDRGGFAVSCAENGEQALEILAQGNYQLMLTDLNMPGMDGIELARRARALRPELTVIMGTGQLSPEVQQLAAAAGISAVFGKPFTYDKLLKCLRHLRLPPGTER